VTQTEANQRSTQIAYGNNIVQHKVQTGVGNVNTQIAK